MDTEAALFSAPGNQPAGNTFLQNFLSQVIKHLQHQCDKSISHVTITIHGDKEYFSPSKEVRKLEISDPGFNKVVEFQELTMPDVTLQHLVTVIAK
ncbi:hypothetical protein LX64_00048 [Chitinophaga skermanii]|uniref:Uncharacterized protein n=1 Tax=Chitinophaga skermanii TaxID=331697 RepID=A0A327R0N3_9BACT|nr:hypothetical protein [Chitinophaga skermanii]RAJ10446.1 hypothetical protein LX64_00048 [Chitinophaga skermanii]